MFPGMAHSLINRIINALVNDNGNKPPDKPMVGAACNLSICRDSERRRGYFCRDGGRGKELF